MKKPTAIMLNTDRVYTLEDLHKWERPNTLAVLGHPVAHSRSPLMHEAALTSLSQAVQPLPEGIEYVKFDLPPERLPEVLPLFHQKGFLGLNLTVPHKIQVLEKQLAVPDSETVLRMGAANTLKRTADGWRAFNTDGYGLSHAVAEAFTPGAALPLCDHSVVLLGAGGAARAAAYQCLREGCRELWIGNRNQQRLRALGEWFDDPRIRLFDLSNPPAKMPHRCLLINATSVGLRQGDGSPFTFAGRTEQWKVFDMIYEPAETPLMQAAQNCGYPAVNGLEMLIWQGALALAIWLEPTLESACLRAPELAPPMRAALKPA